ncbi:M16 family metallopeptidase [Carboxylicivirga sp. RSCT41]|uniref:M16 family metallopeptidase n=1 Tax=Carboxylicivirga agarovorans TaxID=3417570 RepID=UPI003D32B604
MYKTTIFIISLIVSWTSLLSQQFTDLTQQVPLNAAIKKGVLPNGLTYYICHNNKPEDRVNFYIYQNVGAVLENEEQDGLAHFLEHMAFNGTKTFPGNSLIDMLERNGVKFGKDLNAYTAQNETVYNINNVPSANKELIDSCLLILRDWSNELLLDVDEIDAERGVISEEWRTRRNAGFRIRRKTGPTIYNGSIYAYRDVIGELDVIKNFKPKELRDFYHDWYRTDLQAIAVVGNVDTDVIERKIIDLFSPIPAVENPKERNTVIIPDNPEPLYVLATDNEVSSINIALSVRYEDKSDNTIGSWRQSLVDGYFSSLINARIREIAQKGDAPFDRASIGFSSLARGYKTFKVSVSAKKGKEAEAFETVYTELQRVINHGFTAGELERRKTNSLVSAENAYKRRDEKTTESYCNAIKADFLNNRSSPDPEFSYRFVKEIVPGISLEEVSGAATAYLRDLNRVYTVIGPEEEGLNHMSQQDIEAIIARIEAKDLEPYVDNTPVNSSLLKSTPQGGKIVSEKPLDAFSATEWTLSNGIRVVYRFADYQKRSVSLRAVSYGGTSLYQPDDLPSVSAAASYVSGFGLGQYDPVQLGKVLTGKTAQCSYKLGSFTESIMGASTPEDIETMFQLMYMRFNEPRFDEEKFDNLKERARERLKNKVVTAQTIMSDTMKVIMANGNPRSLKFDEDYIDQINFERMKQIYDERFANAGDFTFFIVGDVDAEILKPMVEKYIASLSSTADRETWVNNGSYFPKGKNMHRILVPMEEPKATVVIQMKAGTRYSRENIIYHSILGSILNLRYTENIREKEGGTYGVGVKASTSRIPQVTNSLNISFDCDPERADYLKALVYKELNVIQKKVEQTDLDKVVLNMQKNSQNKTEYNSYWMSALLTWYDSGENILEPDYLDDIVDKVSTADIEKAARKFLKKADTVEVLFLPEE